MGWPSSSSPNTATTWPAAQLINRLHALLVKLIPSGLPRGLTAEGAAQSTAAHPARDPLGRTLRRGTLVLQVRPGLPDPPQSEKGIPRRPQVHYAFRGNGRYAGMPGVSGRRDRGCFYGASSGSSGSDVAR